MHGTQGDTAAVRGDTPLAQGDTRSAQGDAKVRKATRDSHKATVRGLGLKRMNQVRELQDTPEVRGMITKVAYLVKVVG